LKFRQLSTLDKKQEVNTLQSRFGVIDKELLSDILQVIAHCLGCGGALSFSGISDYGQGQAFSVKMACSKCQVLWIFPSSRCDEKQRFEVPHKFMAAACLSGLSSSRLEEYYSLIGMNTFNRGIYAETYKTIGTLAEKELQVMLAQNCEDIRKAAVEGGSVLVQIDIEGNTQQRPQIFIMMDGRYPSRGFNSEEATIVIADAHTGKIMKLKNVIRHRSEERSHANYSGSAKAMETHGIKILLQELKDEGFDVETYCHDDDSSGKLAVISIHPNANEALCISHAAKSVMKRVKKVGKDHPAAYGLGKSSFKWMYTACKLSKEAAVAQNWNKQSHTEDLKKRILHYVEHIKGITVNVV
jgi:hypothetical protein